MTSVSAMISGEVGPLRGGQCPVRDLDRVCRVLMQEIGAGELSHEGDEPRIVVEIGEFARTALEDLDGLGRLACLQERLSEGGRGARDRRTIAQVASDPDRTTEVPLGDLVPTRHRCVRCGLPSSLQQLGRLGWIAGHEEGLFEEAECLVIRAEIDRPRRRRLECDLGLTGECVGFGSLGRVRVRGQVMSGEGSRDLVGLHALEEARGGEMAALPVGLGQRVVGDLADQRLDEGVLAALRASWVGLECQ